MGPDIILFDEPFSHLDYPATQDVLKHLIHLHREGHTLILTTHDVEKVIAHVDRVAIIHQGELKAAGPRTKWSLISCSLESGLPATSFWERRSHGSTIDAPLLSWKFVPSPVGRSLQISRTAYVRQPFSRRKRRGYFSTPVSSSVSLPCRGCHGGNFLRDFRTWAIFLFVLFLVQSFFSAGSRLSDDPWIPVSREGLRMGGLMCWRLGLILGYAVLFTAVTRPRELQNALRLAFSNPFRLFLDGTSGSWFPSPSDSFQSFWITSRRFVGHRIRLADSAEEPSS